MKKIFTLLFIALLMLSGCSKKADTLTDGNLSNDPQKVSYDFKYLGKEYKLGESFNVEDYDKPLEYSEVTSYAFEGLDKTYKYNHFELTTFPVNGVDTLYVVNFLDDKISTNEGLKISDTFEDMINIYGNDFYQEVNLYTYSEGKKNINIIVQNGFVTDIEYRYSLN